MESPKKTRRVLLSIIFLGVGVLLLFLAFYQVDFQQAWKNIQEVQFRWLAAVLLVSLLTHVIRAWRWKLLLNELDPSITLFDSFIALMAGYFTSLGIPRIGEITRCSVLWKKYGTAFPAIGGTVLAERSIDVFCLFFFAALSMVLQLKKLGQFVHEELLAPIKDLLQNATLTLIILAAFGILLVVGVIILYRKLKKGLLKRLLEQLLKGFSTVLTMKRKGLFLGHTLLIWTGYFLMTYLWFFSYEEIQTLTAKDGLFIWSVANLSRTLPIHGGGMGAFHYLVSGAFKLFNVQGNLSITLATLMHLTQTLFYITVGGASMIVVLLQQFRMKRRDK